MQHSNTIWYVIERHKTLHEIWWCRIIWNIHIAKLIYQRLNLLKHVSMWRWCFTSIKIPFKKINGNLYTGNTVSILKRGPGYVYSRKTRSIPWWRHQMETFSALLTICARNSPVPGEFPSQRPVTLSFDVFFDLRLNKRLSKHLWGWWFETPSRPLWRHCNAMVTDAMTRVATLSGTIGLII